MMPQAPWRDGYVYCCSKLTLTERSASAGGVGLLLLRSVGITSISAPRERSWCQDLSSALHRARPGAANRNRHGTKYAKIATTHPSKHGTSVTAAIQTLRSDWALSSEACIAKQGYLEWERFFQEHLSCAFTVITKHTPLFCFGVHSDKEV